MAAQSKIERAHQMYKEGKHGEALGLYTEALAMAKTKAQRIALHSNRAACFLKLHQEEEEEEEEGITLTGEHKCEDPKISPKAPVTLTQNLEAPPDVLPKGWGAIPKPSGHSTLDYSRWDRVENDSSEEEDDEEEEQPQYRFRVRTVGVRPVK